MNSIVQQTTVFGHGTKRKGDVAHVGFDQDVFVTERFQVRVRAGAGSARRIRALKPVGCVVAHLAR